MSLSGIHTVSFYDNNMIDDGDPHVQQVNDIKSGQGEIIIGNPIEGVNLDAGGANVYSGFENHLELAVYDMAVQEQLEYWMKQGRKINMVGAGEQNAIMWHSDTRVKVLPRQFPMFGNKNYLNVEMHRSGGNPAIRQGVNLLDMAVKIRGYETGWQDSDNDDLADGYEESNGSVAISFIDQVQTLETINASSRLEYLFTFPITGIPVTISSLITEFHPEGTNQIGIIFRDKTSSVISSLADTAALNPERSTLSAYTANNSYILTAAPLRHPTSDIETTGQAKMKNPALRLDGSDEYVNY